MCCTSCLRSRSETSRVCLEGKYYAMLSEELVDFFFVTFIKLNLYLQVNLYTAPHLLSFITGFLSVLYPHQMLVVQL